MSSARAHWLAELRRRAQQPPLPTRAKLVIAGAACGSLEHELARRMHEAGLPLQWDGSRWSLIGTPDEALERIARWLHGQGHAGRWRDEQLAVVDASGAVRARVERAAARVLGITTFAVHLVGRTPEGRVWVQQRALDKAVDPGLLDTLVGGLAAHGESTEQTLERESWEEAGLRIADLRGLAPMGRFVVERPLPEGHMVERIAMFEAELPAGLQPMNQDGEVMAFQCLSPDELIEGLREGRYTFEATLIHAHWLEKRGRL